MTAPASPASELYDPLGELDIQRIQTEADRFFDSIDTNGDGVVSVPEMRSHLESTGYAEGAVDKVFALLDLDANGELDREEMRASFVKYDDPALRLALGLGTSEADQVFDAVDTNGDGAITQAELIAYMGSNGYPKPGATATTIFETLDVDGDGTVSRGELREGYVKYSALRQALGLGRKTGAGNAAKNPKGQPKRWGRGRKKDAVPIGLQDSDGK